MKRFTGILAILSFLALGSACSKKAQEPPRPEGPTISDAPEIAIKADSDHLYNYYPAGKRAAVTVKTIDEIPADARGLVIVVPQDVEAPPGLLYKADLREQLGDGSYPYEVMRAADLARVLDESRGSVESVAASKPAPSAADKPAVVVPAGAIVMYSTSWCGACAQARRWLRNKSLPYTERDVEKESGARAEMHKRAKAIGYPESNLTGVPVFYVNGKMRTGFDAGWVMSALEKS